MEYCSLCKVTASKWRNESSVICYNLTFFPFDRFMISEVLASHPAHAPFSLQAHCPAWFCATFECDTSSVSGILKRRSWTYLWKATDMKSALFIQVRCWPSLASNTEDFVCIFLFPFVCRSSFSLIQHHRLGLFFSPVIKYNINIYWIFLKPTEMRCRATLWSNTEEWNLFC